MKTALDHLKALVRAIPAISKPEGPSRFLGASCSLMAAYDEARAFLRTQPRPEAVRVAELLDANNRYLDRSRRAEAQVRTYREALTPSSDTKAAYAGEFKMRVIQTVFDEDGELDEVASDITVEWTTIKEIMAAISAQAETLFPSEQSGEADVQG